MNNHWKGLLYQYYDTISDEYLKWMSKEYEIPIEELKSKEAAVKEKIMNDIDRFLQTGNNIDLKHKPRSMSSLKAEASREQTASSEYSDSKYAKMSRAELISLSKQRKLPIKRKNLDMIAQLVLSD